ncbi:MAG TPA: DUF6597 domain-containing transcriptional factor, partial [Bryobacteraceae bacterium]|nr:DUF6597 domain-containing transcriptional factor [Bryobacteraceae bacterium]
MPPAYSEFSPGARIAQYVECYWFLEVRRGRPSHQVLPDGCVDILFSKPNAQPAALTVVGLMTAPVSPSLEPGECFFGVRFRPAMASALIPETAALTDKVEPLESFWGSKANGLLNRLAECRSGEEMARIVERELRPLEPPDALDRALSRLSSGNPEGLSYLAEEHGMSARHFRRRCQVRSGVPPKLL